MAGPDGEAELQQTPVPDGEDGVGQVGVDHHLALTERLEHGIFIETKNIVCPHLEYLGDVGGHPGVDQHQLGELVTGHVRSPVEHQGNIHFIVELVA